jgi:hypothetical protein
MTLAASYATLITPYPEWLLVSAWVFLSLSFLCAVIIVVDERRRPQNMTIMNFVWLITALYFGRPLCGATSSQAQR